MESSKWSPKAIGNGLRPDTAPIDYILCRAPAALNLSVQADLRFEDKLSIAGRKAYLSDHLGIEARFGW